MVNGQWLMVNSQWSKVNGQLETTYRKQKGYIMSSLNIQYGTPAFT